MSTKKPKIDIEAVQEKLQGIRNQEGILGYILRAQKSAAVDLKDPTKIMDYALFSTTARDVGCNMTEIFQMGEVDSIVVESGETKLLSMNLNNHHLSLFMEKNVDHNKLFKSLM